MTERAGRRAFVGTTVAAASVALVVGIASGSVVGWGFPGSLGVWGVGFAASGGIIDRGDTGRIVGRLLMWAGLAAAIVQLGQQIGSTFDVPVLLVAMASFGWMVPVTILMTAFARFPDGAWAFRGARATVGSMAVAAVASAPVGLTSPGDIELPNGVIVSNPWGVPVWDSLPPWISSLPFVVVQLASLATVVGVVWSVSKGDAVHRRQAAWVVSAIAGVAVLASLSAALYGPSAMGPLTVLAAGSVLLIPVSIVIAVTRYRLYEIDRIVSRTMTYVVVVGVLGMVYAVLVLGLRSLVPGVEGPLPVALSTLAVAFAFFPLARRIQALIDRRFFRSRYDAASVVAAFAGELRSTVDAGALVGRTETVVGDTFQAESVTVWLSEQPT